MIVEKDSVFTNNKYIQYITSVFLKINNLRYQKKIRKKVAIIEGVWVKLAESNR